MSATVLRLGARGSLLSRLQSGMVARQLEEKAGVKVELVIVSTSGDKIQDRPLHEFGGKGLFTKELEQALLRGEVDFAVHSFKDVPVTMPLVDTAELVIAAVPKREDARDVLVSRKARAIGELAEGAKVGTGSLRRRAQVLALRPDLKVEMIRGNVDTRVRKLNDGEYDAVVLAFAGLKRAGLFDATYMYPVPMEELLPAAGQGALAIECRRDAKEIREILHLLADEKTAAAVAIEREVVRALNGDCHSPIGAYAEVLGDEVNLMTAVGARDGNPPVLRADARFPLMVPEDAVQAVVRQLKAGGAEGLLAG